MPLEAASLILAHYTAKVKDTGDAVDTTRAEDAQQLGIHDPTRRYEPRLVAVGEGWVLKGVDEALATANVGDRLTVEVPPEKGFGPRDPSKVRMIPIRRFGDKADQISTGDEVEIDNRIGIVRFTGSGRAQVDFNHRYAGKTLVYDLQILSKLETDAEKINALIRRRLPIPEEQMKVENDGATLRIRLPQDVYLAEGLQIIKRAISNDIFRFVKTVGHVEFVEGFDAPPPKEPERPIGEKAEAATESAPSPPDALGPEAPVPSEPAAEPLPSPPAPSPRRSKRRQPVQEAEVEAPSPEG